MTTAKKKAVVLTQQYMKTHLYAAIEASEVRIRTAFVDARDAMLKRRETESSLLATESRIRNHFVEAIAAIRKSISDDLEEKLKTFPNASESMVAAAKDTISLREHLAVANSHIQRLMAEKDALRNYCKNMELQNKELTKGRTDTEMLLRSSLLRTTMILGRVVTAWKSRHISKMEVMDAVIKRADEVLEQVESNLENANG